MTTGGGAGDASGALLRLTATHMLVGAGGARAGDALASVDQAAGPGGQVFVPSPLPCGECPYCRRALVSACRQAQAPLTLDNRRAAVPERFVTPVSEPAWANLPAPVVAAAGLAAEVLEATARSGLGPGDTAIWIGAQPWVALGATFSARRSCRTFTVAAAQRTGDQSIVSLDLADDPNATIAAAEAASGAGHGRPERRIFVYDAGDASAEAALALAGPGTTISFRRGVPSSLAGLDRSGPLRLLLGSGYHPDLIPEALALLARGEIDVSSSIREVSLPELDPALESLRAEIDCRFLVVRLG